MTRVVLLGASNLAIGLPLIVRQLCAGLPRPLEIFAACGHGRSFCTWSRVLFRDLPGIDRCGLWTDLERAAPSDASPHAGPRDRRRQRFDLRLVARRDCAPRRTCLTALARHRAELVVTRLPLASVERLSALRYHATKAVFFSRGRRELARDARSGRASWMRRWARSAARFSARLIEQPLDWYGFDPIHIRRAGEPMRGERFSRAGRRTTPVDRAALFSQDRLRLRLAAPAERLLFGRRQLKSQPALTWNGVSLHLY